MGGSYYDRDVYTAPVTYTRGSSSSSATSGTYSKTSESVFKKVQKLDSSLEPTRFKNTMLKTGVKNPVVCAIDVTGSMGDWTKIIYDKMPMMYGQIMMQGYLTDPAVSFCGVGDANSDDAPLQVTSFGKGRELDSMLGKMWLEAGGGGGVEETYDLAAYFYSKRCDISKCNVPFFFFTGDEAFYEEVEKDHIKEYIGQTVNESPKSIQVFRDLKTKFKGNVFLLKKPYWSEKEDVNIKKMWTDVLGKENILEFKTAKAVVDIMLGAMAIVSKTRNLDKYLQDMKTRGQSADRIKEVRAALYDLSQKVGGTYSSLETGSKVSVPTFDDTKVPQPAVPTFEQVNIVNDGNGMKQPVVPNMFSSQEEDPRESFKKIVLGLEYEKDKKDDEIVKLKNQLRLIKAEKEHLFPVEFLCPITQEVLADPVITDDGHTYERAAIAMWLKNHDTSPLTNVRLKSKKLRPNIILKKFIQEYVAKNQK